MDIRVRFAPSPTGVMHIGNLRIALMNYLFAKQKDGTFVLRIEDTDPMRNFDPQAEKIISDLNWLKLYYDEGPLKEGKFGPYFESQRTELYKKKLKELETKGLIYRCFCTTEELEKKRQRQIALKQPPRYDKTCTKLTEKEINEKLEKQIPFIWRFKLNPNEIIEIKDLVRGNIKFDMKNFSDFPVTRQDGSFTFSFANCVDDIEMKISHVIRGEDHISNTAGQAALYKAFEANLPTFWHLPIICNIDGKKLSKRDFGFSLNDLKNSGFLPEAINNYLGIIGGSFKNEILSLEELTKEINFENMHPASLIKYDVDKLKWINHKWISLYDPKKLELLARPFLEDKYPEAEKLSKEKFTSLLEIIKTDIYTLADIPNSLKFYFEKPSVNKNFLSENFTTEELEKTAKIIGQNLNLLDSSDKFMEQIKKSCQEQNIKPNIVFKFIRIALTGKTKGLSINSLLQAFDKKEIEERFKKLIL